MIYIKTLLFDPKQSIKNHITPLIVIGLGSLTLLTHNAQFLVWKPTILYSIGAIALAGSQAIRGTSLIEKLFQMANIHAEHYHWYRLDMIFICFLVTMAVINLLVFKHYGIDFWVKFKLYSIFLWWGLFIPAIIHVEQHSKKGNL